MTLDDLPTITVKAITGGRATGAFDDERWIGEGHIAWIPGTQY